MEAILQKLKVELAELEDELHNKLPKEISRAREWGDLKENAEYKAAMERQSFVSARIGQVLERIREVDSIDLSKVPTDRVGYGSKVKLYDLDRDEEVEYKLLTQEESDPEKGLISTSSPIGQGLIGREVGDEVRVKTPKGWRNFEIADLVTIHEQGE